MGSTQRNCKDKIYVLEREKLTVSLEAEGMGLDRGQDMQGRKV